MPVFETNLKTFIAADLSARVTALTIPSADVYFGIRPRINRADIEAWCRYVNFEEVTKQAGVLRRHRVEVQIYRRNWDESEEDNLAATVSLAAEQLATAYDEAEATFQAGAALAAEVIDRVRCERGQVQGDGTIQRWCFVTIDVDEWQR